MKMRNVHTDATRESIMVSNDFFRFIEESMLFTCNIIKRDTLNSTFQAISM